MRRMNPCNKLPGSLPSPAGRPATHATRVVGKAAETRIARHLGPSKEVIKVESVSFQASLKGLNTKPDGIEVKLKTATVDGVLLRELAPMMLQAFLDVTIEPPIRQHELPFSGLTEASGAEQDERKDGAGRTLTQSAPEKTDDGSSEINNVEWILGCTVGDVNYEAALSRLTDDELLYCLKCETRKTGRSRLRAEARRRGLKLDAGPARERDAEDKDDGQRGRVVAFF